LSIKNEVYCVDNMEYMSTVPDKFFDLAIPDPPYGKNINESEMKGERIKAVNETWDDEIPPKEYFDELFRVSKYQIIWGGNYFLDYLGACHSPIVWDKINPMPGKRHDFEMAWTNFKKTARIYKQAWIGYARLWKEKDKPIHKTQKPVALYKWLLQNYAQPGWKIFDSHVGSGSSRIACHDMGFDFIGTENDPYYWQAQEDRFKNHISQNNLFAQDEMQDLIFQGSL
jgi:site-specific DNA-methyltransferase (adenine-specific)